MIEARSMIARVVLLLTLAVCWGPAVCQESPQSPEADLSEAGLKARLAELRPVIEAALGEPFLASPELKIVGDAELEELIYEGEVVHRRVLSGSPALTLLRDQCRSMAALLTQFVAGYVDTTTGALRISPSDLRETAAARGYASLPQHVVDLILAHEAAHVFQDQRIGLARMHGCVSSEESVKCRAAVAEGHAQFIARRVAERLGVAGAWEEFEKVILDPPDLPESSLLRGLVAVALVEHGFAYRDGHVFFEELVKRETYPRAFRSVFFDPPFRRLQVMRPKEYQHPSEAAPSLSALADFLEGRVSSLKYGRQTTRLAGESLGAMINAALPEASLEVLAHYRGGVVLLAQPRLGLRPGRLLTLTTLVMEDEEDARALASLVTRTNEANSRKGSGGMLRVTASSSEPCEVGGAAGVYHERTVELYTRTLEGRIATLAQGVFVVEVSSVDVLDAKSEVLALAGKVLAGLDDAGILSSSSLLCQVAQAGGDPVDVPVRVQVTREDAAESNVLRVELPGRAVHEATLTLQAEASLRKAAVRGRVAYRRGGVPSEGWVRLWPVAAGSRPVTLPLEEGRFSATLPAGLRCVIGLIGVDGLTVDHRLGRHFVPGDGKELILKIRKPRTATLVVRDAVTGAPVPAVRAYRSEAPLRLRAFTDPEALARDPKHGDATGRVFLGRTGSDQSRWIVLAPGHAQEIVELPARHDGDQEVTLRPGGDLQLSVQNWGTFPEAMLWLEPRDPNPDDADPLKLPDPDARGSERVSGLPPGRYTLTLRQGWPHDRGPVYGTVALEIRPREVTDVVLETSPGPPMISYVLEIAWPDGWVVDGLPIGRLEGRGGDVRGISRLIDFGDDGLEFPCTQDLGRLPEGHYVLTIDHLPYETEITLHGDRPRVRVEIPPAVGARIRLVDGKTGAALTEAEVTWGRDVGDESSIWRRDREAQWDPVRGEACLRTAPGKIRLRVRAPGYAETEHRFLVSGPEDYVEVLPLSPGGRLCITFSEAGRSLPDSMLIILSNREGFERGEKFDVEDDQILIDGLPVGSLNVYSREIGMHDGEIEAGATAKLEAAWR